MHQPNKPSQKEQRKANQELKKKRLEKEVQAKLEAEQTAKDKQRKSRTIAVSTVTAFALVAGGIIGVKKCSSEENEQITPEKITENEYVEDITKVPGFNIQKTEHQMKYPKLQEEIQEASQKFIIFVRAFNAKNTLAINDKEAVNHTEKAINEWSKQLDPKLQEALKKSAYPIPLALREMFFDVGINISPDRFYTNNKVQMVICIDKITNTYQVAPLHDSIFKKAKKQPISTHTLEPIERPTECTTQGNYNKYLDIIQLHPSTLKTPQDAKETLYDEMFHSLGKYEFPLTLSLPPTTLIKNKPIKHIYQAISLLGNITAKKDSITTISYLKNMKYAYTMPEYTLGLSFAENSAQTLHTWLKINDNNYQEKNYKKSFDYILRNRRLFSPDIKKQIIKQWKQDLDPYLNEMRKIEQYLEKNNHTNKKLPTPTQ